MKSFWEKSYDGAKDRRYGMLFFGTLLVFFGAIALGAGVYGFSGTITFQEYSLPILLGAAVYFIVLFVLVWRWFRRARKCQQERLKYASLSRDELFKARSKLRNEVKLIRRPAPRAPDTDLKY